MIVRSPDGHVSFAGGGSTVRDVAMEVEVKLAAWPGFELPSLDQVADDVEARAGERTSMDARYFDAEDLRLLRSGITLRHRSGEGGPTGTWTLKSDARDGDDDGVARRDEWTVVAPLEELPPAMAAHVRPWLRTAPLVPVAHIRTDRSRTALLRDGAVVGEVDDDEVSVVVDDHVAARFREVEVECADPGLRQRVVDVLRGAGAGAPDRAPKLVRAVGPRALGPPDVVPLDVDEDASATEVLRAGITASTLRIMDNDAVIRADGDPEGVHQARVGCRRLRSDLRTFAPLLVTDRAEPLRQELRWLASSLGDVRDLDVLGDRLRRQIAELPTTDLDGAHVVLQHLDRQREDAVTGAIAALDSHRYLELLDDLVAVAADPPTTAAGDAPASDVLPGLAGRAFDRLRKHVRRLPKHPTDEQLHDLRIQAKKARYAADVAVPVAGKRARRYTKAMGRLQDVLGDLHDAHVAEVWLRDAAAVLDARTAFVLGSLAEVQRQEQRALRRRWHSAWVDVDDVTLTRWMR